MGSAIDDRWNVAFVVVVVVVVVKVVGDVVVIVVHVVVDPRNLSLKFGLNGVKSRWDINDTQFKMLYSWNITF